MPRVSDWNDVFQHSRAINKPSAKSAAEVRGMEDRIAQYQKYSAQFAEPAAPAAPVAMKAPAAPEKEKDIFEPFRTRKDVEELQKEMQQVVTPEEKKALDE
jgi:hypothetical protein